jgi:hypothetical protein
MDLDRVENEPHQLAVATRRVARLAKAWLMLVAFSVASMPATAGCVIYSGRALGQCLPSQAAVGAKTSVPLSVSRNAPRGAPPRRPEKNITLPGSAINDQLTN